jgi:Na+/melibiose symporter-like transporter
LLNGIMALGGFGVNKIGYVNLSTLGSALVVLSLMLDSIVPNTSWLFLSFSLIGGIGNGVLCIPYYSVLFSQMSGPMLPVAVGFAAAGGGVGTIVFNLILEPLHQTFGWRHARQILAAALLVILTLNTLVLRCCTRQKQESPNDSMEESNSASSDTSSGSQPSQFRLGRELVELVRPLATPSFLLLSVGLVLYMCGFTAPYTHVVYYAELQVYENAAMLVSVVGAGSTVGRILCSFDVLLADFLWKLECGNILVTGLPQDLTVNSLK